MMRSSKRSPGSSQTFRRPRSMALFTPSSSIPKKSPLVEFPASPQLILGEEITHFSHPHRLSKIDLLDLFTCAGCKEYGAGKRFSCQQCDYQLHDFCGSAPRTLTGHPPHSHHPLAFHSKPPGGIGISKSKCSMCAKPIKGYRFQCTACSFQMHTNCTMLQEEIAVSSHDHALNLISKSSGEPAGSLCGGCRRKRSGRVYRCTVCDYHLHAVCAKEMASGLIGPEFKGHEKRSMIGAAAKLASQVVVDFIGGLIEAIGQGVGEAIVQNIARGRCYSSRRGED
ncbi:hypothetical protein SAY86_011770 [Trapa natans]|uniref:DC1 domain-containing protein n=1 Tax=Trapa natans TaxID=22666 RepID=A0AAN7R335_TRANT|nr:hypothetical protein SAY86_011770 [Trapa natans]